MTTRPRTEAPGLRIRPGDWDGFFALFFSTFPDLLLIASLGPLCGFTMQFVTTRILPGLALSLFAGNMFYAWQARRLALATGRDDVTAIPFGVNTPTVFAYIFLVMLPVYRQSHDPELTWQIGLFACFLSGIIQTAGAFCTDWLRRNTPRAALLCPLAGIALAFLCLGFILRVFQAPELALLPTIVLLTLFCSHLRMPFRIPGVGVVHRGGHRADGDPEGPASLPAGRHAGDGGAGLLPAAPGQRAGVSFASGGLEIPVRDRADEPARHDLLAAGVGERQGGR
jgi:hypothetical protein